MAVLLEVSYNKSCNYNHLLKIKELVVKSKSVFDVTQLFENILADLFTAIEQIGPSNFSVRIIWVLSLVTFARFYLLCRFGAY